MYLVFRKTLKLMKSHCLNLMLSTPLSTISTEIIQPTFTISKNQLANLSHKSGLKNENLPKITRRKRTKNAAVEEYATVIQEAIWIWEWDVREDHKMFCQSAFVLIQIGDFLDLFENKNTITLTNVLYCSSSNVTLIFSLFDASKHRYILGLKEHLRAIFIPLPTSVCRP